MNEQQVQAIVEPRTANRRRPSVVGLLVMALLGVVGGDGGTCQARTYGLLVGVSSYPSLEPQFQLAGPDNDIDLARETLIRSGVEAADISVLKSSGAVKPNRDNIIKGLQGLARKVGPGDIVYLHFAGHGSQQPARAEDTGEGDGLDEIILPEDIGKWQDEVGAVERAISDNEIDTLLTNIRRNGAFVWAVFDSCHSGTMLRSVSRTRWRNVDASALGVPRGTNRTRSLSTGGGHYGQPAPLTIETAQSGALGGFVAFYAAQTNELAPELELPADGQQKSAHGLFSYALAEAMASAPGATYRQLGQIILQKYVRQGMRATTPLIEGTDLDKVALGNTSVVTPRQWPVNLRGARTKQLFIPAGALSQIGEGALFALMPEGGAPDEQALGYAVAVQVEPFGAELRPVAREGKPVVELASLPRGTLARLVSPAFRFPLRVALPATGEALTDREKRLAQTLGGLAAAPVDAASEGLRIDWGASEGDADIRLVFSPPALPAGAGGPVIAAGSEADCPRDRLWFVDPTGALICNGPRANLSFEIGEPSVAFDDNTRAALDDWLSAIGKVRNLEQMVGSLGGGAFSAEIDVRLFVKRRGETSEREVDASQRSPLQAGDTIRLEVNNNADGQTDLTVLFVDSRYGITPLFPTDGRTNRIERGERVTNIGGEITADTQGLEGLLVIASKAVTGAPVADFSFLGQKHLQQKRLLRSVGGSPSTGGEGADASAVFLNDLIASAGFRAADRPRTRSVSGGAAAPKTPYRMVTLKSLRWIVGDK